VDAQAAVAPAPGELHHTLEEGCPHVELDLLRHAQAVVEEVGQAVAAACPRLDPKQEPPVAGRLGAEADLTGLEVAVERYKAKAGGRPFDHAHRSVPGAGHAHHVVVAHAHLAGLPGELLEGGELGGRGAIRVAREHRHELLGRAGRVADRDLVATAVERAGAVTRPLQLVAVDAVGQRGRLVLIPRAPLLGATERRGAPHVAPRGERDSDRPAGGGGQAAKYGLIRRHSARSTGYPAVMLTNTLARIGLRGWHLHASSLATIYLCITLWIRAKTVDQEERGNAERRALFVGLWPPMFWLMGDALQGEERAKSVTRRILPASRGTRGTWKIAKR
jgi:hypothetical protein